jgi:hypothetical protein
MGAQPSAFPLDQKFNPADFKKLMKSSYGKQALNLLINLKQGGLPESSPEVQKLLPVLLKLASGNEITAKDFQDTDPSALMQELKTFLQSSKPREEARKDLVDHLSNRLFTPPLEE